MRIAGAALLAMSLTLFSCGGKATLDDGIGGGATSTASTASSSVTTVTHPPTTTPACDCTTDADCPEVDDACFYFACEACTCAKTPEPPGVACMAGVCDGNEKCVACLVSGDCNSGETCVNQICVSTIGALCEQTCSQLKACLGESPTCMQTCTDDLGDCDAAEIGEVAACGGQLANG